MTQHVSYWSQRVDVTQWLWWSSSRALNSIKPGLRPIHSINFRVVTYQNRPNCRPLFVCWTIYYGGRQNRCCCHYCYRPDTLKAKFENSRFLLGAVITGVKPLLVMGNNIRILIWIGV